MTEPSIASSGSRIEDTSKRDPLLHLAGSWDDPSRYITDMEAAGQRQLVNSDRLPVDVGGWSADQDYLDIGFTFGDPDPSDPLFRPATLPPGWKRQGSDHAMWSYIVDTNGRRRVSVFYKAAFYDRKAHMHLATPEGEVAELLWSEDESTRPVIDDWMTREVWIRELTAYRNRALVEADKEESYYPPGVKRHREHAARCDRLLAELVNA